MDILFFVGVVYFLFLYFFYKVLTELSLLYNLVMTQAVYQN